MKNKRAATKRVLLQATQPKTPKRRRHAITRRLSSSASASTSTSHVESSDSSPDEGKQVDSGSVKNANKEYFKWDCPVNDDSIPDSQRIQHGFDLTDLPSSKTWVELLKKHGIARYILYVSPGDRDSKEGRLLYRKTHWKGETLDVYTSRNPLHPLPRQNTGFFIFMSSDEGYVGYIGVRGAKYYVKKFVDDLRSVANIKGESARMCVGPYMAINAESTCVRDLETSTEGEHVTWDPKYERQNLRNITWTEDDAAKLVACRSSDAVKIVEAQGARSTCQFM
eukprot:gb/GECG01010338.1/.p1 GENE.gb/GECG01010338.1/~~gb/GECG01010338.1/.p1  ORF type:complete len:281 (+),score=34.03 gb/GECG01010338.1/:1-843(+)